MMEGFVVLLIIGAVLFGLLIYGTLVVAALVLFIYYFAKGAWWYTKASL